VRVLQNSEKNTREKITRGKIKVLFHGATSKSSERKVSRKQRKRQEEKSFSVSTSSSFATTSSRRGNRMLIRNYLPLIVVSPAHQTFITAIAFSCQRFLFPNLLSQLRKRILQVAAAVFSSSSPPPGAAVNLGRPVSTASVSADKRLFYCIVFEARNKTNAHPPAAEQQ
jgi:hypothetical protein